jgi:hypothetical protein
VILGTALTDKGLNLDSRGSNGKLLQGNFVLTEL